MADRVWFITGTSRGFGRSLAEHALELGDSVAGTARDLAKLAPLVETYGDRFLPLLLDVTDVDQVNTAVAAAIARFGHVDVIVNNAGYGLEGAVEEVTDEQIRHQLDTNLLGPLWVTRAALPHLREQGSGHIIQISSVGGRVAFPAVGLYHASKWGLEGFSESLAAEVAPFGIKVTIIEPGGFRTDWAGDSMVRAGRIPAYAETLDAARAARLERSGHQAGDPDKFARVIVDVVESPEPPLRLALGTDAADFIAVVEASRQAEREAWDAVSRSTDFDDA